MADLIKDFSMHCLYSQREDNQISNYFRMFLQLLQVVEEVRQQLLGAFDVDGFFQVVLIGIEDSDQFDAIERRKFLFNWNYVLKKYKAHIHFLV